MSKFTYISILKQSKTALDYIRIDEDVKKYFDEK